MSSALISIGSAIVQNKVTDKPLEVSIKRTSGEKITFVATGQTAPYFTVNVGHFIACISKPEDTASDKVNKLVLERLISRNPKDFSGVEKVMLQTAIEFSYLENCNGKVYINVSESEQVFYYNQGFRTETPSLDLTLSDAVAKGITSTDLGPQLMHLADEEKPSWQEIIRRSPIFRC